jgi:hypothetical protein
VRGFRQESAEARARGCAIIEGSKLPTDARGVYAGAVTFEGVKRKQSRSSFFPVEWTQADVLAAIAEANEHRRPGKRSNMWEGVGRGLQIRLETDASGRIEDARPFTPKLSSRKRSCRKCEKKLIRVCPGGHDQSRRWMTKKMRWLRRWLLWKLRN